MRYAPTLLGMRNRAVQWHDNPNRKKMKAIPRERLNTKTGTLTLPDARLPCDKCMTYTAVGGSLYTEPATRLPDRKNSIQNQAP